MELAILRIVLIFFLCPAKSTAQVVKDNTDSVEVDNRRVLLVGIDGLRPDALQKALAEIKREGDVEGSRYPYFVDLFKRGVVDYSVYAGGDQGGKTEQETSSGPGWVTTLTGVWADAHNVRSDRDLEGGKRFDSRYPTLFNYVGRLFPEMASVALVNWWPLSVFVKSKAQGPKPRNVYARRSDDLAEFVQNDQFLVDEAIRSLQRDKPKLLLLQLGALQKTGQVRGYGPDNAKYMQAVKAKAGQINNVMKEIDSQRRRRALDWLVVVTSTHGGHGQTSGSQDPQDRSVFVLLQNPAHPEYSALDWLVVVTSTHGGHGQTSGSQDPQDRSVFVLLQNPAHPEYSGGRQISTYQGIDSVAPTVMDFLAPHKFQPNSRAYKYLGEPIVASGSAQIGPSQLLAVISIVFAAQLLSRFVV